MSNFIATYFPNLTVCRKKSPTSKVGDEFRPMERDKSPKVKSVEKI